ncbi:NADH:flavin oxidoreductase [Desulforhopalus vacuolatus]|uniref:NADH:flavin oxidoreductase n=1 Tax=Desulforhopalus vacuolatus TaxID=40414 RepID=UPI001965F904|nr:NADH:flavin oxidoreductase [Desulforhopalus vacuolatus]MBM9520350.1 NADH:flavin oxidoreductase [Desulforhopalus vacuolatus]
MQLFEETKIGNMILRNRFIRASLWMKGAKEGHITPALQQTYNDLAVGGVGLILSGYMYISPDERPNVGMVAICDDSFVPELQAFVDEIHQHGGKIAAQICYGGSQSDHPDAAQMKMIGPSAVKNRVSGITPKEATTEDLAAIRTLFVDAAVRAKKAGFDGVQLHAAHGYFLSMFLTPYYNRRTDEYNGTIHDRARIIYEVVEEVRKAVGPDFPVMIKINHDDFMDEGEGLVFEDALEVMKHLDTMGLDLIEVSGSNESSGKGMGPARTEIIREDEQSYFREATEKIAAAIKTPVSLMGGNRSIRVMNKILNSSEIRFFSVARPLLSEPDLINRWGMDMGYRPKCVSCNRCGKTTPNSCILNRMTM